MTRLHATAQGNVPFTPEEEAEFDAMETAAQQATDAPARTKEEILADIDALRAEVETHATFDQLQALSDG